MSYEVASTLGAGQLRHELEHVHPEDTEPDVVGASLLHALIWGDRFGLDDNSLDRCVASIATPERRVALEGPLFAYLCLLYREETVATYGREFADQAWASFTKYLEKLAGTDDQGRDVAATIWHWVTKLDAMLSAFRSQDSEIMEAMEVSEDAFLGAGVVHAISADDGDQAAFSWEDSSDVDHEQVGRVFETARGLVKDRIRTRVRVAAVVEK
jgi:hypothetical protein